MAAVAALRFYYMLTRRLAAKEDGGRWLLARRPAQPPATWIETMTTLTETLRFTYSETLGKWPIADFAFGIIYLMRKQGNLQVASVYAGSDCVELKGPEIIAELNSLLELLTLCMHFSKKPFDQVFLESAGYSLDVLVQKPKAGLLKPAFTILRDGKSKCLLLLIRGTHSIKDTLTAATGAAVPFRHSVLHDGGISNLVLGYAHCGMVAAARWIAKLSTPCLLKALGEYPDYKVKIVGHSLGGGTAALLTYILREQKEFSSCTCFTFGPAACMTLDLAESGKHFITTLINGSDLVPTFSAAAVDDLHTEVTASSWLNGLRDLVERRRVRIRRRVRRRVRKVVSSVLSYLMPVRNIEDEDGDDEDERLMSVYGDIASSSTKGIKKGALWFKLEKELERLENEVDVQAREEKAAAASMSISSSDVAESHHFYPPGRIMHMVSIPSSSDMPSNERERVGIFETPRKLYGKVRPSRTMLDDHFMRMYKKMIEVLIMELENHDEKESDMCMAPLKSCNPCCS